MSNKVYEIVTERIIALLKKGVVPWRKPWNVENGPRTPRNLISGKPYRGINVFLLACTEFRSPYFLTFRQAKARGGSVRKGEHGFPVTFWKILDKVDDERKVVDHIPLLRYYTVFNVDQCDGVNYPRDTAPATFNPVEAAESVVKAIPSPRPSIRHDGETGRGPAGETFEAFYRHATDTVHLPAPELFERPEFYYSTLFHEVIHATGHKDRLDRLDLATYSRRDGTRPREELTAEMGAAFLCAHVGIEQATIENSAAYIASWLTALQNDPRLVVQAAGQAQRAADWVLGVKREEEASTTDGAELASAAD